MGKAPLSDVDSWILVLATISKLSGRGGRLTVEATTDRIQRTLKEIYGRDLTKREVENILRDLLNRGFIFKEKGLLRDGRAVLYGINSSKIAREAFNLIKIDRERAYVHNGYEGLVFDPPSTEAALRANHHEDYWTTFLKSQGLIADFPQDYWTKFLKSQGLIASLLEEK